LSNTPNGMEGEAAPPEEAPLARFFRKSDLTEKSTLGVNPPYFQGTLYPPQAAVVAKMQSMERQQVFGVKNDVDVCFALTYNAGLLAAPFAFGKTVVITALIASEQSPRKVPPTLSLPDQSEDTSESTHDISVVFNGSPTHAMSRRRRHTVRSQFATKNPEQYPSLTLEWYPQRYIHSTLILVSNSVMSHWRDTIAQFVPHLSIFLVDGIRHLREYHRMSQTGEHTDFHAVILKVGSTTLPVNGVKTSMSTLTALNLLLPGVIWDRVVLDDFDSVPIASSATLPPAFFTWYVSATRRLTLTTVGNAGNVELGDSTQVDQALEKIMPGGWPASAATRDDLLFSTLQVNCNKAFRESQFVLPAPRVIDYTFQGNSMLRLFQGLDLPEDVQEALNSGAIGTAARQLGFDCSTPAELASRVLDKNKSNLLESSASLGVLDSVTAELKRRAAHPGFQSKPISATETRHVMIEVRKGWRPDEEAPLPMCVAPNSVFSEAYSDTEAEYRSKLTETRGQSGRALERLRENASEGTCQVCLLPWDLCDAPEKVDPAGALGVPAAAAAAPEAAPPAEATTPPADAMSPPVEAGSSRFVANCCQTLICATCVTRQDWAGGRRFLDECPNCFSKIVKKVDGRAECLIIALGPDIQLEHLSVENLKEDPADTAAAAPAPITVNPQTEVEWQVKIVEVWKSFGKDDKIRGLLQLVVGLPPEVEKQQPGNPIPGLLGNDNPMVGHSYANEILLEEQPKRRYLVFTYYRESTRRILDAFEMAGISATQLRNNRTEKDRAINTFRRSQKPREVLVILASKDCAGIHLPECTDEIFYHRVRCANVSAQLAGRGQRPGRKASLRIHNLLYSNE
jgi:hypothetical protein